jgi:hypothetical protein
MIWELFEPNSVNTDFFFQGSNLEKSQVPALKSFFRVQIKRLTTVAWKPNNLNYTGRRSG